MNRFNLFLLGCLVIQVILIVLFASPFTGGTSEVVEEIEIFKGLPWSSIDRIEVKDNRNEEIILQVKDGKWVVETLNDYPVKENSVKEVTDKLRNLRSDRIIASNPANHATLEVLKGKAQREVKLFGPGKAYLAQFYLGKMLNNRHSTIREEGRNEVFGVKESLNYTLSTFPSAWIDTQAIKFDLKDVKEFILKHSGETFRIEKKDEEWWLKEPEECKADKNVVERMIRTFSTLRFTEPLGKEEKPEYGLSEPSLEIEAFLTDGNSHKAIFGAKKEKDNTNPGKVAGNEFVLSFFSHYAESSLKKGLEDIKEKTPEDLKIQVPSPPGEAQPPQEPVKEAPEKETGEKAEKAKKEKE